MFLMILFFIIKRAIRNSLTVLTVLCTVNMMGLFRISNRMDFCAARRIFSSSDPRSYHSKACKVFPLLSLLSITVVVVVV